MRYASYSTGYGFVVDYKPDTADVGVFFIIEKPVGCHGEPYAEIYRRFPDKHHRWIS